MCIQFYRFVHFLVNHDLAVASATLTYQMFFGGSWPSCCALKSFNTQLAVDYPLHVFFLFKSYVMYVML